MGYDVNANNASYQEFINMLNSKGIKTTSINSSKEADFGDYGSVLSNDLKQQICDSFDCEQDYALQQQIAGLYTNRSVMNSADFQAACKKMGLNVKVEYQKTSYISDYKAGNFSNSVTNGSIAVYTISDGMGGEIKIADANGNGALESEEIFMNQILGDINNEIGNITPANVQVDSSMSADNTVSSILAEDKDVSQEDFNKRVEKYVLMGNSISQATNKANADFDDYTLSYTGTLVEENESDEEESPNVSQEEFNEKVEQHLQNGASKLNAIEFANFELGIFGYEYTGDEDIEEIAS